MPNFEKVRTELMSESRFMAWCQTATHEERSKSLNQLIVDAVEKEIAE